MQKRCAHTHESLYLVDEVPVPQCVCSDGTAVTVRDYEMRNTRIPLQAFCKPRSKNFACLLPVSVIVLSRPLKAPVFRGHPLSISLGDFAQFRFKIPSKRFSGADSKSLEADVQRRLPDLRGDLRYAHDLLARYPSLASFSKKELRGGKVRWGDQPVQGEESARKARGEAARCRVGEGMGFRALSREEATQNKVGGPRPPARRQGR